MGMLDVAYGTSSGGLSQRHTATTKSKAIAAIDNGDILN